MAFPADAETVREKLPSKLDRETVALAASHAASLVRNSLDGTGWLRLYRAVATQDEVKLAEMLEEAERAFLKAVQDGEVHRDSHGSPWYVEHMLGRRT